MEQLSQADILKGIEVFAQYEMDLKAGLEKEDPNIDIKTIKELLS